jgi:hyaluronoglucosaminidase
LYWDNFPVNDGGLQKSLYIGPVRGREVGLQKYSAGLVSNPMLQFEMSQIPLFTIGEYLWNTSAYNPDQSWENALVALIDDENDRICLRKFLRTSMGTAVGGDPAPDLRQVFRKGVTHWRAAQLQEAGQVFIDAGKDIILNHGSLLSPNFSKPLMIAEIEKWLEKYLIGGEVLIGLGNVLKSCGFDQDKRCISGGAEQVEQLAALKERLEAHRKNLFGDQIEGPINELMAELQS